ncbi:MAG: succinylglutamate desuccinylase/aspartoacylase family protein [Xanthomonadales bacterium]|nr:succinylglutamate desuccinylase/aspartoacylase family protein [Xanthomonadales bacterium]
MPDPAAVAVDSGEVRWSPLCALLFGLVLGSAAGAQTLPVSTEVDTEAPSQIPVQSETEAALLDSHEGLDTPPAPAMIGGPSSLIVLGHDIAPGRIRTLKWAAGQTFVGTALETPVVVVRGALPGPTLCLTAGIHGDELNGIEVVRRVLARTQPAELSGTLIGVPIVNLAGFSRGSRYLPDRRDLNRFFPGRPNGSSASRIAHSFFNGVIQHCDALVDFHTGSFERTNLPQVRGDLRIAAVLEMTRGFGATSVLHSPGSRGMLRRAATEAGIPAVTFELGAPVRLQPEEIEHGVHAMETLLYKLGIARRARLWREPQPVFYDAKWVRVTTGGFFFSNVKLGESIRAGQRVGRVVDPVSDFSTEIVSPVRGRVLGMALNQVVMPGFAAFNIGVETSEVQAVLDAKIRDPAAEELSDLERVDEAEGEGEESPPTTPATPPEDEEDRDGE